MISASADGLTPIAAESRKMETERIDRVLIIDDDNATRQVLEKALRRLGYAVESAGDGEEGLKLATSHPPEVIITDIQMPKMDGHTLLRRLRAQNSDSAVVMMSGHGGMDDVVDALRNGAVDYLKKPWVQADLLAAVARAAEIAETRREIHRARIASPEAPAAGGVPPPASAPGVPAVALDQNGPPKTAKEIQDAVFASILEGLRRGELTLPPIPRVLNDLRLLISRPETTIEQVVALIERDQRAAAQVIRLANSVQFAGLTRVNDIQTAVSRVGFRQIENIAETAFAQTCYRATSPRFSPLQARIWKHSLARAVTMRGLAELAGPASGLNPATAYLAGLMSDAGAAFLLWVIAERERASPPGREPDALVDCTAMIRSQHQQVGAMLIRSWNLDPVIAFIASSHHADQPPAPTNPYWGLSIVAAKTADQLVGNEDATSSHPPSAALIDRCSAELRIGHTAFKALLNKLVRELEAILETLS